MKQTQRFCLVVCFFVCPLLFFTNLTRNPYIAQISLLSIGLLFAAAAACLEAGRDGSLPRTPLDLPLAAWTGVCALSWVVAYAGHAPFFRPSMRSEGARSFLFLLVNVLLPFYLAAACVGRAPEGEDEKISLVTWVVFVLVWGLLWTAFPQMRGPGAAATDFWGHFWDGYGALLWAGGVATACWLCRRGRWIDYLHLVLAAGFLASVYGVCQYFNLEFIWPSALNPYGGRSVSTFGNPNFMSSFNVILLPFAVVLYLRSRGATRLAYAAAALALEAALLCSLTRSSWIGLIVALAVLALSPEARRMAREDPRPNGLFAGAAVLMALVWPQSAISGGYASSVLGRVIEAGLLAKPAQGPYAPWYQRVLIWICAWLMGAENPLTGKGWGLFELFYPFYQGHILNTLDFFRNMRTHANNAHNELLETWSQTGILGVGALLWLWTTFFTASRRWFKSAGSQASLRVAAVAAAAGMLADNQLNVSLHFAVPAFLFWWVAGAAVGGVPGEDSGRRAAGPLARPFSLALAALLASLSWYWVKVWNREAHYFAGFKVLRQGSLSGATKELELSRDWGPPEVNAIYELGNAYARAERFSDADKTYAQSLRANAGYDEIYYNLGAIKSSRLGQTEAAIDYFRVAQWINPFSAETYNSLGNLYLQNPGRYADQAIALLARAVHFFPDNPNHWNNLGYLYTLKKQDGLAEKAYTQALIIEPGMLAAERNLRGMTLQRRRPAPKILSGLDDMRRLDALVAGKDYSDATLSLAARVAAQFPEMAKAQFLYGSLLLMKGRAAEAVKPLDWAASHGEGRAWVHTNLGNAYRSLGRSAEAIGEFRKALSIDPQNSAARDGLRALAISQ